jgi:acyl carrier protein
MTPALDEICSDITFLLSTMTADWNFDGIVIDGTTRLSEDLCFSSIDLLNLLASIDVRYRRKLPYERLIMDGDRYRADITLAQLASFVHDHFDVSTPPVRGM